MKDVASIPVTRKLEIYEAITFGIKLGYITDGWEKTSPPLNKKMILEMELCGLKRLKEDVEGRKISMCSIS